MEYRPEQPVQNTLNNSSSGSQQQAFNGAQSFNQQDDPGQITSAGAPMMGSPVNPCAVGVMYRQTPQMPYAYPYYQPYADPNTVRLNIEKKAVKRTANHIGLGLVLFEIASVVIQIILMIVLQLFHRTELLYDSVFLLLFNIGITLIGFPTVACFISRSEKQKISGMVSFGAPKQGAFWPAVMVGIGFCYVANEVTVLLQSNLSGLFPFASNDIDLPTGAWGIALGMLSTAVFPALLEELIFRGAIMGSLLKFGKGFALFTSALIFGLVHGNLEQIPFAFMVGLVLGFAVLETESIWTGVVIHFLNNLLSVVLEYVQLYGGENLAQAIYLLLLAALIMLGFFGIYLISLKNKNILKFKPTAHLSTAGQRFGWFSGSAAIIIFYVLIGLEVLSLQIQVFLQ